MSIILTLRLAIELTQNCNLNCSHCFRGAARNRNISDNILEKVFDEVKFVHTLDLSGGEVFLGYEQLKMLLEIAKQKDVIIKSCKMLTNGTIYDERIYKLLDKYFGNNYQVGISNDDFHDKSIHRIYKKNSIDSKNPDLHPASLNDVQNNMHRHISHENCKFQRLSNRLISNGRAINTQTPHKNFEAMGYYFNRISPKALLVGPVIFVGADGFISDINSDLDKRNEQSLGNINQKPISDLVINGGIELFECKDIKDINKFFELMDKRLNDFRTHQGDHLLFKDGKMKHFTPVENEDYNKALNDLPSFCKNALEAIKRNTLPTFLKPDSDQFNYPGDLAQIEHTDNNNER